VIVEEQRTQNGDGAHSRGSRPQSTLSVSASAQPSSGPEFAAQNQADGYSAG
jgi:hypothetical protein